MAPSRGFAHKGDRGVGVRQEEFEGIENEQMAHGGEASSLTRTGAYRCDNCPRTVSARVWHNSSLRGERVAAVDADWEWIFGYGSLVWRPAIPFVEKHPGFIVGWSRKFWQGSTDHRGVPGAPGRVVTLVKDPGRRCWGMAFKIDGADREEVVARLDHREQGGYDRFLVDVLATGDKKLGRALLYVAGPENPNYLGPAPAAELLDQIRRSSGPSGSNIEYVVELAKALRGMGAYDPDLYELADALVGPGEASAPR